MSSNSGGPRRKYLVVVRAGEKTLHRAWLKDARRNWDLVVSWYGSAPYLPVEDERVLEVVGGKFDGLYTTFAAMPELLQDYSHIWLPDDDIETDCATINGIFLSAEKHKLSVCQPALSRDSYFFHMHTVVCPSFELRFTNFVEIMVPCLSRELLSQILPDCEGHMTGFGLNNIWCRLERDNFRRSAILDSLTVRHTRPIGRFLRSRARQQQHDPNAMRIKIFERYGYRPKPESFPVYGGISAKGAHRGPTATRVLMIRDHLMGAGAWVEDTAWKRFRALYLKKRPFPSLDQLTLTT